jgi:hypothetical protein
MENKISAVLDEQKITEICQRIDDIKSLLPFLIDLTPEERKTLPKLGDKSLMFATKALDLIKKDFSFMPGNFSIEEMEKDIVLFDKMLRVRLEIGKLFELVDDTTIEVGSEAYTAALTVYDNAKRNGKNTVGMDGALDELSRRFYRKTAPQKPEQPK